MTTVTLTENDIHNGNLILVNAKYPLKKQRKTELIPADPAYVDILMERSAATVFSHILRHMNCTEEIVPVSGYRSQREQERLYADSLQDNGRAFTEKYVALPCHSEHQTGLAIDVGLKQAVIDFICPDFPYEGVCNRFRAAAPQYGFTQRYQSGKEAITGIAHEPWHFRFVGYPHSFIISEWGLTLEEYIDVLRDYPYDGEHLEIPMGSQKAEIFYLPFLCSAPTTLSIQSGCPYQISGNNIDGFIVTIFNAENINESR